MKMEQQDLNMEPSLIRVHNGSVLVNVAAACYQIKDSAPLEIQLNLATDKGSRVLISVG